MLLARRDGVHRLGRREVGLVVHVVRPSLFGAERITAVLLDPLRLRAKRPTGRNDPSLIMRHPVTSGRRYSSTSPPQPRFVGVVSPASRRRGRRCISPPARA